MNFQKDVLERTSREFWVTTLDGGSVPIRANLYCMSPDMSGRVYKFERPSLRVVKILVQGMKGHLLKVPL